jgi:DNA-binding LytR/AlgR family response regulator
MISTGEIDILFSDIDMPNLTGLSLVKSLKDPPVIIFISAFPEYAAESFSLDVLDFIVKPVTFERVLKAFNKAADHLVKYSRPADAEIVYSSTIDRKDYFFIKESASLIKIYYEDVLYIESMGDFSRIFTIGGKQHVALANLKSLEMQLPAYCFTRVHKRFIINHHHISSIGQEELTLKNSQEIPLSSSYRQELLDKVAEHHVIKRSVR